MRNKKSNIKTIALLFILISLGGKSQDTIFLSETEFINYLKKYHPILKSYDLITKRADENLKIAKGSLDPKLKSDISSKQFDSKNYYEHIEGALVVPTWFGPDFKLSYSDNSGTYLNNENFNPEGGLVSFGASIPILQGTLIDERRNAIKQSKLLVKASAAERTSMINKFLSKAVSDYWKWYYNFHKLKQFEHGYKLSRERYFFTVERSLQGDVAPIDSVETSIQMQSLLINYNQSKIDYYNSLAILNTYLWKENNMPVEFSEKIAPALYSPISMLELKDTTQKLIDWSRDNNPEIIKQNLKIEQLIIEKKFSGNNLLPKITINYDLLGSASNFDQGRFFNGQDYKLGGQLYFPLLLRKERGKLALTKIKLLESQYQLDQSKRNIENQLKAIINQCFVSYELIEIQKRIVSNSKKLRDAEKIKFENGESSVFLINSRELMLLNNRIKFYETLQKYRNAQIELYLTGGNLLNQFGIN
ncbi:MAG: TolC family protein [Bacteroidia bacterium]